MIIFNVWLDWCKVNRKYQAIIGFLFASLRGKKLIELPYTVKGMDVSFSGILSYIEVSVKFWWWQWWVIFVVYCCCCFFAYLYVFVCMYFIFPKYFKFIKQSLLFSICLHITGWSKKCTTAHSYTELI